VIQLFLSSSWITGPRSPRAEPKRKGGRIRILKELKNMNKLGNSLTLIIGGKPMFLEKN